MASAGYRFPAIEGNGPPSWIPGEIRRFHLDDSAESIVWTQCVLSQAKRATRPACRRIGYSGVCIEYVGMRAAYRRSPAKDRPFIPWDKSLIEIEMMGLTAMKKHAHSPRYTPGWGLNGVRPQLAIRFRVVAPRSATPRCSECLSASSRFSHTRRASLSGLASDTDGSLVANGQPPPGVGCRRFGRSGAGSWPARPSGAASVAARSKACRAPISIVA